MGSDDHYPEEAPAHRVIVDGFWMDQFAVTNAEFRRFVKEIGYVTIAERALNPDDYPGAQPTLLVPGSVVFQRPWRRVDLRDYHNWWAYVPGANWRHPEGPGSTLAGRERHPVVHVAHEDAAAYATWAGKALPTEAEWEYAARGGIEGAIYSWGDEFAPKGRLMANTWQGVFPWQNVRANGHEGTAPVGSFPPNGYRLYDMTGNVWQWTMDWYTSRHAVDVDKPCCIPINPGGRARAQSYDSVIPHVRIPRRVIKGGSYLCAPNYCQRYRPAARSPQQIDTGACHLGFRCVVRPRHEGPIRRAGYRIDRAHHGS